MLYLNNQSLLPKFDLIPAKSEAYDLLIVSESWLKPEIKSDSTGLTFYFILREFNCNLQNNNVNKQTELITLIFLMNYFLPVQVTRKYFVKLLNNS